MDVNYINPFLIAMRDVFNTMVNLPLEAGKPYLRQHNEPTYAVSAAIGISGNVTGAAVLSFPLEVAIAVASALSGTQLKSLNQDCVDALGEIANMVAGGAKAQMPGTGNKLSLPYVVLGQHRVAFPRGVPIIVIPFDTPAGRFILEIAFKAVAVPAQQAAA